MPHLQCPDSERRVVVGQARELQEAADLVGGRLAHHHIGDSAALALALPCLLTFLRTPVGGREQATGAVGLESGSGSGSMGGL